MRDLYSSLATILACTSYLVEAQSGCSTTLTPTNSIKPTVASGYRAALVATGLTKPRSLQFDTNGNLLVVQQGVGISSHVLQDDGGTCISVKSSKMLISNTALNHGIALSSDGKTLYASSSSEAASWTYDPSGSTVANHNTTLVIGMNTDDHTTRTLLIPRMADDLLLVSRGSTSNVDPEAELLSSGHSQIRAFNLTNMTSSSYSYDTDGLRLGWGLRNSVGVAEHPVSGGIFSVENSVDQLERQGVDVHENNPGEEMNFHGYLNGTEYAPQGTNYGYPFCFAAWTPQELPNHSNLTVGSNFAMGDQNSTVNDTLCAERTPPRLTFQAHMAPLDIKFNDTGNEAWVTFHGSWDRTDPVGYKLSRIPFSNGMPVAAPDNNTATTDIFYNVDNSACPGNCFRPVGIAFDKQGRLFVASDASGEVYVVVRDEAASGNATSTGSSPSSTSSSSTSPAATTSSPSAASMTAYSIAALVMALLFACGLTI